MQIILSHVNTDFDAFASMIAAKKLYPDALLVLPDKQEDRVNRFLNIYRDTFDFVRDIHVDWDKVETIIMVDVASLKRVGKVPASLKAENVHMIVYDHHPRQADNVKEDAGKVEQVGAAVTLLIEEIKAQNVPITEFEATLFALGLYTDTGNFIYKNTTQRDLEAASYLMASGMNLELVQRFSEQTLEIGQQDLLDELLSTATTYEMDGLEIIVSTHELKKFQGGLALVTNKLLEIKGGDAALSIVKMKNHVHVVGRATSDRVNLLPLLKKLGGGGHSHAGSALIKKGDTNEVLDLVSYQLDSILKPAITAAEIMSRPVKTLSPETTIEEAGNLMYRYGHSGYPITKDGKLVGLITRRDLDKGNFHGLGHAPVKAYMTTDVKTVEATTTLEELQKLIIDHNIGRLPVIDKGEIVGIVTRTNIIEILHNQFTPFHVETEEVPEKNYQSLMEEQLPEDIYNLLKQIGEVASKQQLPAYLIGGIVRDLLLHRPNDDIDIVVEGNGISFANELQETFGGSVLVHDSFGTATWTHPSQGMIDITSARLEFYQRPASLPDVELSTLAEDLQRRDFTINAMGLRLNDDAFGDLIDPFGGREDLDNQRIKTLHNISFVEDPTRIFRAIRFEQRFQFLMDAQTTNLALNSMDKVKELSATRLVQEMKRLLTEGDAAAVLTRLYELDFWTQYGLSKDQQEVTNEAAKQFKAHLQALDAFEQNEWYPFFCLPFFVGGKLTVAEQFALRKNDRHFYEEVTQLAAYPFDAAHVAVEDLHPKLKDFSIQALVFVAVAKDGPAKKQVLQYIKKRRALPQYFTGQDLMQAGLKPGPHFSQIFVQIEIEQLAGRIKSKEEANQWLQQYLRKANP